ncbi:MAG: gliding motility-associated peptidyl-prolyl isomerase GldI [Flavobacteriaceae bacterium]|nr:gliding motility-associated peptidyl-prolyl isomerase GldI [Flavobacteriaceae bacterium]
MLRNLIIVLFCALLTLSCKSPDARRPVKSSSGTFIKESAKRNKKLFEKEQAVIEGIIELDTNNDYLASESGFWYYYNSRDSTATSSPKMGDAVTFTYDVRRLNGEIVVSSEENGLQNYKIDQTNQELISGIRDGLKLMKEGETVTFLFPSFKAYGYYGIEDKLGTNIPIQSTVTLKSIKSEDN